MHDENGMVFEGLAENRENYFVEYKPACPGDHFASLTLTYLGTPESSDVAIAMEAECLYWMKRYPVSIFVGAFNHEDDLIPLDSVRATDNLTGVLFGGKPQLQWKLLSNDEFPHGKYSEAQLRVAYQGLPFSSLQDRRKRVLGGLKRRYWLSLGMAVLFLVAAILIAFADSLSKPLGIAVAITATVKALWRFLKITKVIGPSRAEKERASVWSKKEHYFYHCERNADAFNALMVENLSKEIRQGNQNRMEELRAAKEDNLKTR